MEFEFPQRYKTICIVFCLITTMIIIFTDSICLIVIFGAVPIAVLSACIIMMKPKIIDEYIVLFKTINPICDDTRTIKKRVLDLLETYIKLKNLTVDITYYNLDTIESINGIKTVVDFTEEKMVDAARKIYSRVIVSDARGAYYREDISYIEKYLEIGMEVKNKTAVLLNEITEINEGLFDLSLVTSYINNLKSLNSKE